MKFEVEKLPKKEYKLKITIEDEKVEETRNHVIDEMAKNAEVKGFRKGEAPRAMIEANLDKGKIRGEVVNHIVPPAYDQAIKETHLRPILLPKVELVEYEDGKDLIFTATTCEAPDFALGDYKSQITNNKSQIKKEKTILGADGQPINKSERGEENEETKINSLLESVLSVSKIEICDLLIDEEVNHMLSRLIDQTGRLGMTVDQYLLSLNKNVEVLKSEYKQSAEKTLKLEFLLASIGQAEAISVSDEEINETIQAAPDDETRKNLANPESRAYIKSILFKNKTIQKLMEYNK